MPLPSETQQHDPPIFQDDPTQQQGAPGATPTGEAAPGGGATPQDDPTQDPRVQLAIERAKNETLQEVIKNGGVQRQDPATTAQVPPPVQLPNDPLDLLNPQGKAQMEQLLVTDPVGYGRQYANLAAQLERAKLEQQAAPLVASQASTFVELFKARMARGSDAKIAAQIEPIFDNMLKGLDLRPLVQMTPEARDSELMLRWNAAKAQVLERMQNAPAPRAEPLLTSSGPGINGPSGPKKTKAEEDPFIGRMSAEFKYTPEQLAQLEELM